MQAISITIRIAVAYLIAMGAILSGFVILAKSQNRLYTVLEAEDTRADRLRFAGEYQQLVHKLIFQLESYHFTGDSAWTVRFDNSFPQLKHCSQQIQALWQDQTDLQPQFENIASYLRRWSDELVAATINSNTPEAHKRFHDRQEAALNRLTELTQKFDFKEQEHRKAASRAIQMTRDRVYQDFCGFGAIVLLSLMMFWRWNLSAIRRPVRQLEENLTQVARGEIAPDFRPEMVPIEFRGLVNAYQKVCQLNTQSSKLYTAELETLNAQLLKGLIPICAACKKIRTEGGQWVPLEQYVRSRTSADFTHALCPDCLTSARGDI